MKLLHRPSKLFVSGLCVLWSQSGRQHAAQAPAMSVTPANPTISVGQTQQFTANGATAPAAVSAGGEYTCVRLPDGTVQCMGRNQFGQHGNGTIDQLLGSGAGQRPHHRDPRDCRRRVRVRAAWRTARRGAGGWASPGSGATEASQPSHSERPVAVSGLTGAVDIAAGYGHACALLCERHDAVLGREPRRAARQRDHHQSRYLRNRSR